MAKCCAVFCLNKYKKTNIHNFSYFTFPKYIVSFNLWAKNIGRPDLQYKLMDQSMKKYYVCEEHFRVEDVLVLGKIKRLKEGSVPNKIIIRTSLMHNFPGNEYKQSPNNSFSEDFMDFAGLSERSICHVDLEVDEFPYENIVIHTEEAIDLISRPVIIKQEYVTYVKDSDSVKSQPQEKAHVKSTTHDESNKKAKENVNDCSGSTVCPHYISFIEGKAENYKLRRELEQSIEKAALMTNYNNQLLNEIELLQEKLLIREKVKDEPESPKPSDCSNFDYFFVVEKKNEEENFSR